VSAYKQQGWTRQKQSTNGGDRPLVLIQRIAGPKTGKFPKNPLFTTCGHYRHKKTGGQAGFYCFFVLVQGLTTVSGKGFSVENFVDK
jgi:hypothetical protein